MKFLGHSFNIKRQQSVTLVPGYYFFIESIKLPSEIEKEEIANFLEYSLEDISPFPMEQLHWGFITHEDSPHALIYASYKPRLKNEDIGDFNNDHHVLPSFLALHGLSTEEPAWYFIQHNDSLCAQYYEANNPIPLIIENIKIEGDQEKLENAFAAKEKLLQFLSQSDAVTDSGIIRCEETINDDESLRFILQHYNSPTSSPYEISDSQFANSAAIWNADIRDQSFAIKEIKKRQLHTNLWKAVKAAGIAASVLLALEIGQTISNLIIDNRKSEISKQLEPVARVNIKKESLKQLKDLFDGELQPFDMLEAMNVGRSSSIYYKSVESKSQKSNNRYVIIGEAPSVSAANAFYSKLNRSNHLTNIASPQTKPIANNKIKFTIELNFEPLDKKKESVALK